MDQITIGCLISLAIVYKRHRRTVQKKESACATAYCVLININHGLERSGTLGFRRGEQRLPDDFHASERLMLQKSLRGNYIRAPKPGVSADMLSLP